MSDGVKIVKAGDILEVTIDRPKANAIDLATSRRLNDVFTSFRDDAALKIAIITGAGDRFFSPGWDLKAAAAGENSDEDWGVGGFGGFDVGTIDFSEIFGDMFGFGDVFGGGGRRTGGIGWVRSRERFPGPCNRDKLGDGGS